MKEFSSITDANLVRLLVQGEHGAFEKLFKRYGQKIFIFSLSYLKSEADAGEVVQEVFLKVWGKRLSLRADGSFQSYLFTIAYNSIKKSFNKKAKEDRFKLELADSLDNGQSVVDYEKNYQLVTEKLALFIDEMPEKRKEIFIQRKKHGKPVRQTALEMSVSVKTVENQITGAMKYLKKRFEDELPGGLLFYALFLEK